MAETDVGALLRRARERADLTRDALAVEAGTSRGSLANYELGRHSPTVRTLDRLLAACGLQARILLEPLMADLDARVDVLEGPLPDWEPGPWAQLVRSLEDDPGAQDGWGGRPAVRRGPVSWAVDGASALVLHGLAAEPNGLEAMDVVVLLDEALRFWLRAVAVQGESETGRPVQDWLDADPERLAEGLAGVRYSRRGFVRVRVVREWTSEQPTRVLMGVPWHERPVPVLAVDEVERTNPAYAEVLARWRSRREAR